MKRWYDKNEELAKQFENFKNLRPKDKYTIIQGMLDFIQNHNPDILNKFIVPLDIEKWNRRWYDNEPAFWLFFNSIKFADEQLLQKVTAYMKKKIESL